MNKYAGETTEQLQQLRDELIESIATIKSQLNHAKAETAATGRYADRHWFQAASHALRMKGKDHQLVLAELGRRRREKNQKAQLDEAARFKEAARILLPADLFHQILDAANFDTRRAE